MDRLGLMETYIRVSEAGPFSSAARHLNVGQPAVSNSIAQLEKLLGVRLLIRSRHGLIPSDAGQTYYEHARRAIAGADQADFAARATGASLTGRLRVSGGMIFPKSYLMPRLSTVLAAHPNLSVEIGLHDGKRPRLRGRSACRNRSIHSAPFRWDDCANQLGNSPDNIGQTIVHA
jgi:DNA-binding transcriptional LysR family regulator